MDLKGLETGSKNHSKLQQENLQKYWSVKTKDRRLS